MSAEPIWPGGARGALSLSFDNLGEAAEIELGAVSPEAAGHHHTATRVVPAILAALAARALTATFFVEGLNAELYPDLLRRIDDEGHEVAFHAWRHEEWAGLSAAEQAANLAHGVEAFRGLGLEPRGMRPPGGGLGEGGAGLVGEAGLSYCSPAGEGIGVDRSGTALLPFAWRHVDAACLLPPLGPVREQIAGSAEPIGPDRFLAHLEEELVRLAGRGGFLTIVLHPITVDAWLGEGRLEALLDAVAEAAARGALWVAPCRDVADHVLANPDGFGGGAVLDPTSWA
jgi:peptidoglycan/xylan/chitin deacetylase (PgdA/CDA1 family)